VQKKLNEKQASINKTAHIGDKALNLRETPIKLRSFGAYQKRKKPKSIGNFVRNRRVSNH